MQITNPLWHKEAVIIGYTSALFVTAMTTGSATFAG